MLLKCPTSWNKSYKNPNIPEKYNFMNSSTEESNVKVQFFTILNIA